MKVKTLSRARPGSSVHGIFQARVLEWGAIAFSELKKLMRDKSGLTFKKNLFIIQFAKAKYTPQIKYSAWLQN